MATANELMAMGMPWQQAKALGQSAQTTVTPTGTTQADAAQISEGIGSVILPTAAGSTGVILPDPVGAPIIAIYNNSGQTIIIYAKGATAQINVIAAKSGFSLTSAKAALCVPNGNGWILFMSA